MYWDPLWRKMFTSLKLCTITPLGMCVPEKKNYNKRNKIEKQCKQLVNNEINWVWKSFRFNFIYIIVSNQMRCFSYPEKTADIPRRQFPREITSEKRAEKFHTDDASLPRSDWLEICFNQPHLGNDTSSVWNFCTRFWDVISRGNQWRWRKCRHFSQAMVSPDFAIRWSRSAAV